MTAQIALLLVLLFLMMLVLSFEWLPVDVTALSLISILIVGGILTPQEAFSGFANEVIVILACVFIISGTLIKTGATDWLTNFIFSLAHRGKRRMLVWLMGFAAAISAFFSNTSATAVLMPTSIELSRKAGISPSRILMPLAFGSILGGTCTLIGTSTNLAASGLVTKLGFEPYTFFEFLGIGLILTVVGTVYMVLIGHRLIPARRPMQFTENYDLRRFLTVIVPAEGSSAINQPLGDLKLKELGLTALAVLQNGKRLSPHPLRKIRPDTRIIVKGTEEAVLRCRTDGTFVIEPDMRFTDADFSQDDLAIGEAVLVPQSRLVGKTLRQIEFFHRYGLTVLAIFRRGQAYPARIGSMWLKAGDVLLLQGPSEELDRLKGNLNLWGLIQVDSHVPTKRHGIITLTALGLAIILGSIGVIPLSVALLVAVIVLVVTGCLTMPDAYAMIEWQLLVLIGGLTSFGFAMQKSGAADFLAQHIVTATIPFGLYAVLTAFCVLTLLLTQPLSNAAAALTVLPVAVATADLLNVDPRSMAIFVTLSASLSFITPLEPASLLVYGPGKYRFSDFIRCGLPLTILTSATLILLVPLFWNF